MSARANPCGWVLIASVLVTTASAYGGNPGTAGAPPPFASASCNKDVESVLDEAFRYAKPLSTKDSRPGPKSGDEVRSGYFYLLPDIAVNYADAGCWAKADHILAQSQGLLSDQLKADLAASLIRNGRSGKADELLRTLDKSEKQSDLLVKLAALYEQLGNHEKAEDLIKEIERNTHPKFQGGPTLELVRILIKNGSVDRAEKYAIADQSGYSRTSLIEVAGGYVKRQEIEKGEALISRALRGCQGSDGHCDYALFLTARAYYSAGKPDAAMKYAQKIVAVNTRTQTLIEIAQSTSDESVALKAVETARNYADQCNGNSCRYVAMWIAQGYGAAGQAEKAQDYLDKHFAKDRIGYAIGLEKTVRQLTKRGNVKDAHRLMKLETTKSPSTDQMKQAIAVAELKNGNFEAALESVESIPNSYVQFQAAITLAKVKPTISFTQKWLSQTRPDDRYIGTYAGSVQVLLAAASRNGHVAEARHYIETLNNPLLKARGLIGIAQGLLGKQPGEEWAQSLELTW
jgi:thioredoxin-like negative regulator of GroEL